jgi:cell fate regulator YaaT (PSP1 superfamily)
MTPEILEISFKGNKKDHYFNPKDIKVKPGDFVIVEAEKGVDLGMITKAGRLVTLSNIKGELRSVIRKANEADLTQQEENRKLEKLAAVVGGEKIKAHNLNMKLVDVEYQYDKNKITFYFTSDKRVDFRELVKDLAAKYKTRIELRQISVRDESGRLGGLGVCGKPFCCSSYACEFGAISTQQAKDQKLPLNLCKLTGVCSRLKCCLNYEQSFYEEAAKQYPELYSEYKTSKGKGTIIKVDIFKEEVHLKYSENDEAEILNLKTFNKVAKYVKKKNIPPKSKKNTN